MDETNVNTDETTTEAPKEDAKGLRKQLNDVLAENKALKREKLDTGLEAIGLNAETGLGKAIARDYDGEYTNEAIAEYAKTEYSHEGPATSQHPAAEQIQQGQAALDNVGQQAGSVPIAPTQAQQVAAAEASGDYEKSLGLKANTVGSWFGPGSNPRS